MYLRKADDGETRLLFDTHPCAYRSFFLYSLSTPALAKSGTVLTKPIARVTSTFPSLIKPNDANFPQRI